MPRFRVFVGFAMVGLLNTASTYLLYVALLHFVNYKYAYSAILIFSILFTFTLNQKKVFHGKLHAAIFIWYLVYYLAYSFFSYLIVYYLIEVYNFSELLAPLIAALITLPINFYSSKFILNRKEPEIIDRFRAMGLLHIKALPNSMISSFGLDFASEFWRFSTSANSSRVFATFHGDECNSLALTIYDHEKFIAGLKKQTSFYKAVLCNIYKLAIIREIINQLAGRSHRIPFESLCPELNIIVVSERSRSRGLGKEMVSCIEDDLRVRGYKRYWLKTEANNKKAISFYEKNGFLLVNKIQFSGALNFLFIKNITD